MRREAGRAAVWTYIGLVLLFLYLPLVPPLIFSVGGADGSARLTWHWYATLADNQTLIAALENSALIALAVGMATPPLAILAAMAVRELRLPRLIMMVVLLPLFVPAVSMGLATAFFFRETGIPPSFWTIALVQVMWALPFAFLIVLTAMAGF